MNNRPIGVFDSGVGGLSLVTEISNQLPKESVVFFADSQHQPFGEKSTDEVITYSLNIAEVLVAKGVKALVIACSTASAVALKTISEKYSIPVVGIFTEHLFRDVISLTRNKKVSIISTKLTAKSEFLKNALCQIDPSINVLSVPCSRLVNMISEGDIFTNQIIKCISDYVCPLMEQGADTLVLGCTHFNFIKDLVAHIVGEKMKIAYPPYSSIATLATILKEHTLECFPSNDPTFDLFATGDVDAFTSLVKKLWKSSIYNGINKYTWPEQKEIVHF